MPARWGTIIRASYGARPWHLLTMTAGFALAGYVVATMKPTTLLSAHTWWQSIALWFAAAIVAHDLVLFPIYALADRILWTRSARPRLRSQPLVSVRNHVRIPALGSALTLLVFLPGIIEQGAPTYLAATGQTQEPFLGRWLLLTAAMFGASAVAYTARLALARRRSTSPDDGPGVGRNCAIIAPAERRYPSGDAE
jgi:hypothetical protein